MVYSKLRQAYGLKDLVTHGSPNGSWKSIELNVTGPHGTRKSVASTTWWTNSILPLPDSSGSAQTLSTTSAIYTLNTSGNTQGITMGSKQAMVGTVAGVTLTSSVALGVVGFGNFSWVEGFTLNAAGIGNGGISGGSFGQFRRVAALRSLLAGIIPGGNSALIEVISCGSGTNGYDLINTVTIVDSVACNNGGRGFRYFGGGPILMSGVRAYNNTNRGIDTQSIPSRAVMVNTTLFNNFHGADFVIGAGETTKLNVLGVTAFNNGTDNLRLSNSGSPVTDLMGVLLLNAGTNGLRLSGATTVSNVASAHNGVGILVDAGSTVTARGFFMLGNNTGNNCTVSGTANFATGANNTTCTPTGGLSEASVNANMAATIVGKASSDSVNTSGGGAGTAAYAVGNDWTNFQNTLRGWGMDGAAFPAAGNRSRCAAGTCRIWDASLSSSDTLLLNKSGNGTSANAAFVAGAACPAEVNGNVTVTNSDSEVFLRNAYEIVYGDYQGLSGDYDGLCEAGETCVYMPNVGAYQGHGALEQCTFSAAGGLSGISMYGYQYNTGR